MEDDNVVHFIKDTIFNIDNKRFVIRNVPHQIVDGRKIMNLDVSMKMEMIRHLMLQEEIPRDVDFQDVADLEFDD